MLTVILFRILFLTFATLEGKGYNVCPRYSLNTKLGRRNNQSTVLKKKIFIIHAGNRTTIPRSINRSLLILTELSDCQAIRSQSFKTKLKNYKLRDIITEITQKFF